MERSFVPDLNNYFYLPVSWYVTTFSSKAINFYSSHDFSVEAINYGQTVDNRFKYMFMSTDGSPGVDLRKTDDARGILNLFSNTVLTNNTTARIMNNIFSPAFANATEIHAYFTVKRYRGVSPEDITHTLIT